MNDENEKQASTWITGEGDSNAVPLPQTPTLARRYKDVEIKSEIVPKAFVTI